jgi:hypothetical protein
MEEYNHLPQLIEALHKAMSEHVTKTAHEVRAGAVQRSPDRSGFLESTIYLVTHDASTYGQGVQQPPEDASLLPEVDKPENDQTAYIAVGADYGLYVELGTVHDAAHPYLIPAADAARSAFESPSHLEGALAKVK